MGHDTYDKDSYQKKCTYDCQKCKDSYDKWYKKGDDCKTEWKVKKRCYTVCEFVKVRTVSHKEKKGYTVKYQGDWKYVKDCQSDDSSTHYKKDKYNKYI
jgi:hypothetical protein